MASPTSAERPDVWCSYGRRTRLIQVNKTRPELADVDCGRGRPRSTTDFGCGKSPAKAKARHDRTHNSELPRRALIVDDEFGRATTAGGRAVEALAEELRARGIQVLEALSFEDGQATVASDSAIHCVFIELDPG